MLHCYWCMGNTGGCVGKRMRGHCSIYCAVHLSVLWDSAVWYWLHHELLYLVQYFVKMAAIVEGSRVQGLSLPVMPDPTISGLSPPPPPPVRSLRTWIAPL
jgi:hypothetical protein